MSTETTDTAPRRGRPPKNATVKESLTVDLPEESDLIPMHPPITPNGFRDESLKAWFINHYPDLANWIYTGRVTNNSQP